MSINRREFLSLLGTFSSAAVLTPTAFGRGLAASSHDVWPGYSNAIVIDSLGSPGTKIDSVAVPLTSAELQDVRASGVTAISLSVNNAAPDYDSAIRAIAYWNAEIAAHPDIFLQVRHAEDIAEAKRSGRLGLIYNTQHLDPYGTDLDRLDVFINLGVRIFQPTYNLRTVAGDGCLEPGNAGLSKFGLKWVERLNERNALIDLSHAGERTTLDAIAASRVPIAITHTGCAALSPNPRNKTDAELRKLADKGGYVGMYLMPFLCKQGQQPMADDLIRHIEHAINICGEDHVGIGTDGSISPIAATEEYKKNLADSTAKRIKLGIAAPGEDPNVYQFIPDLNLPDRFARIAELLAQRKHPDSRIEKILGGNFNQLLKTVWKG